MVPQLQNVRRTVDRKKCTLDAEGKPQLVVEKDRVHVWQFPGLEVCRAAFDRLMNCEHSWTKKDNDEGF